MTKRENAHRYQKDKGVSTNYTQGEKVWMRRGKQEAFSNPGTILGGAGVGSYKVKLASGKERIVNQYHLRPRSGEEYSSTTSPDGDFPVFPDKQVREGKVGTEDMQDEHNKNNEKRCELPSPKVTPSLTRPEEPKQGQPSQGMVRRNPDRETRRQKPARFH
jgi:hypothetical protein